MSERTTIGEELLGIEGFSAVRAKRYREEMTGLLAHRISRFERWSLALGAVVFIVFLAVAGVLIMTSPQSHDMEKFNDARLTLAGTLIVTGVCTAAWLIWISLKGGYSRRAGDVIALFIALVVCAGTGLTGLQTAWPLEDPVLRTKILYVCGVLIAFCGGLLHLAAVQRMHRQTQLKLLRIEYHVAELMERSEGSRRGSD
jgi:hypothetical protein